MNHVSGLSALSSRHATPVARLANRLSRRRVVLLSVLASSLVAAYVLTLPIIQVQKIQAETPLTKSFYQAPIIGLLIQSTTNSTGNVNLSLQNFAYSTPDNSTQVSGTSATLQATITPEGANARVDLNVQLNGVHVKSPSFTGSLSSLTLSGFLIVDPTTNKLVVSLVASTSAFDIIRAFLGF